MTVLVIDCSVTMPWCFEDQSTAFTDVVLEAVAAEAAVVPGLWSIEVANVLAVAIRKKALSGAKVGTFRSVLSGLPIRAEDHPLEQALGRVLDLANEHRLSAYDAAYLEVALRFSLPLATLYKVLKAAAEKAGSKVFLG